MSFATRLVAVLVTIVGTAVWASVANADIKAGSPDETIQQAYGPLQQSVNYSGAFTNPNDVDYLSFVVTSAGESLHFTVSNTLTGCNSPDDDYCPLYATLMDQSNQQVGGNSSSAGTIATVDDTETIDWTFTQPGTYYLLMESNGNLPNGQPTYTVRIGPPPQGGSGGGATGPIVKSISVARHQRGDSVKAGIVLAQRASRLSEVLYALHPGGRRTYVAGLTRSRLAVASYRTAIRLSSFYRRALKRSHRLSLVLKITIVTSLGRRASYTLPVSLRS